MKPVDQTTFGYPAGNCLMACVASILDIGLDDCPELSVTDQNENQGTWWRTTESFLVARGFLPIYLLASQFAGAAPKGYTDRERSEPEEAHDGFRRAGLPLLRRARWRRRPRSASGSDWTRRPSARPCPACGSRKVYSGPVPRPTAPGAVAAWIDNGDTGVSSETIWYALHHEVTHPKHGGVPHDPTDFGRCYRLLQVMPAWKARLQEVVAFCPAWAPFVAVWDELTALYEEELPIGQAPRLYARLHALEEEIR